MNDARNLSLDDLKAEVEEIVSSSSKHELSQCARLLATYIALYKHEFGELSQDRFIDLSQQLAESMEFGEAVYATGLRELLETLSVVDSQSADYQDLAGQSRTVN